MTYYYFYNPKLFIDFGWLKHRKPKDVPENVIEANKTIEKILPEIPGEIAPVFTKELSEKITEFIGISQKISKNEEIITKNLIEKEKKAELLLEQAKLAEQRVVAAIQILLQEEEERALLLMLLH